MEEYQDRSLRGRVFRHLREDILNGVYKDHEELREVTIGEELGVSRTPVREALRQLELEGLVTIIPNKGAYVTAITRKDVKDIYKIRSKLEGLCANWATKYITDAQIEELEEVILLSEFHLHKKGTGQIEQMSEMDGKFHKILYEASNSRILEHVLTDFHKYVQLARTMSIEAPERAEKESGEIVVCTIEKEKLLSHVRVLDIVEKPKETFIENADVLVVAGRGVKKPEDLKTATTKAPTAQEIEDMLFANKIVKNSKSNAIVLAKGKQLLASGVGQTSRVDALKQAIEKAKNFGFDLKGAVMASDAFFPFPDCVEIAGNEGVTAVIQPGGSIKDQLSFDYCNEHGIAMVTTGIRHFKH